MGKGRREKKHKVDATSRLMADLRSRLTGIKYCEEVAEQLDRIDGGKSRVLSWMADYVTGLARKKPEKLEQITMLEGRMHTTDITLKKLRERFGEFMVLELAAGFAPWSINLGDKYYFATDQPHVVDWNIQVLRATGFFKKWVFLPLDAIYSEMDPGCQSGKNFEVDMLNGKSVGGIFVLPEWQNLNQATSRFLSYYAETGKVELPLPFSLSQFEKVRVYAPLNVLDYNSFKETGRMMRALDPVMRIIVFHEGLAFYCDDNNVGEIFKNAGEFLAEFSPEGIYTSTDYSFRKKGLGLKGHMLSIIIKLVTGMPFRGFPEEESVHAFADMGKIEGFVLPNNEAIAMQAENELIPLPAESIRKTAVNYRSWVFGTKEANVMRAIK